MTYFTKKENKRLEEHIKNNAIEHKNNMFDYYKNNEIKEILDYLKESAAKQNLYFEINPEKAKILHDCITNLEQELNKYKKLGFEHLCKKNEELEQENERLEEILVWKQEHEKELHTRIDKAIHRIHNLKQQVQSFGQEIPCWIDELENDLGGDE